MSTLRYYTIDVFSSIPFKGNPLAVVDTTTTTPSLTATQMKLIARQFNLSETTFICPPTDNTTDNPTHTNEPANNKADWRLRSFLPNGEEVFGAGHNSLGAWWWISQSGLVDRPSGNGKTFHQELGNTILPVSISSSPSPSSEHITISMRQGTPQFLNTYTDRESLARSLGIKEPDLGMRYAGIEIDEVRVVTTSPARHLLVPVRSVDVLRGVSFGDKHAIEDVLVRAGSYNSGVYVFTLVSAPVGNEEGSIIPSFEARFFSPAMGMEDPATGSAAGPLGAYLYTGVNGSVGLRGGDGMMRIEVLQGVQTGRRCLMNVRVEDVGDGVGVWISGTGVLVAEGSIVVPSLDLSF
ncbi:hypothetical protein PENANT_c012G04993 [Penicillium antarcticum]|uniref:Phenazine biosynthesis protein n=1 Tax=Penicillium antarcticum TaxID=416450 RepID=A0A1V6Q663_9EURO|nr:uncharacterized protein N7508_007980 [Penicillium antarcticum]KAJ5297731.1 hypothetical protein N7508_007980 [Penicillium antarcticum]OQD84718.1 hypothetical protein PENANT_c012G04993 [Penicillium antarcticum]